MPVFMIFVGLILLVAAIRGTQKDLFEVLRDDFTGSGNYFVWVVAVGVIVAFGYIEKLRPISNAFLTLVVVVIFLANKGLIPSFFAQVKEGTQGTVHTSFGDASIKSIEGLFK